VPIFRPDEEARVRELLAEMERGVELVLVLGPEAIATPAALGLDVAAETQHLLEELVTLAGRVSMRVERAPAYGAERFPAICVLPEGEDVGIRFYGLPWGYELSSLVGACLEAGRREPRLSESSRAALHSLAEELSLDVFVTPT
jgi:alkyl hydroperoxide reductase subunit AhpF